MDDLDRALVRLLTADGRRSNVDLARDLGVAEKTIRNRIARLVARDGLRITARLEAASSGTHMLYWLHAAGGRRERLERELAAHPHVTSVDVATGAADLVVAAAFPSSEEALEFQLSMLQSNPLVADSAACHLIRGSEVAATHQESPSIDRDLLAEFVLRPPDPAEGTRIEQELCDALARIIDADHAMLTTTTDRRPVAQDLPGASTVVATTGFAPEYAAQMLEQFRAADTVSATQRVVASRQHLVIEDARSSALMAPVRDLVEAVGYVSLVVFPLTFGRDIIGFAVTYFDRHVHLDTAYLTAAQTFVDHCAIALARDPAGAGLG